MKSLESQLQKSLILVLVLILLGLLLVANLSTRSLLEDFVTARLEHDAKRLLDNLVLQEGSAKIRRRRINSIYNIPDSGHYYAIKISNTLLTSPSLQNGTIPTPIIKKPTTLHAVNGPQQQHLIVWSKNYQKNGQNIIISVAEDMSQLMKKRRYFTILFVSMGLIGFILMLGSQRFVIRRLFKNLDQSRQEVKQIELGERKQLSEDVPTEIYPLVREFNHSMSLMQQRMERSRHSLGNLAHALKTPLSLLVQQLDSDKSDLSQAKQHAQRISQLTDRELKRARMAGLGNTTQRFDPREELPILIDVLKQAHQKNHLEVDLNIDELVNVFGDREDMLELLGNVMDNACKWSRKKVSCSVLQVEKNAINIVIEDDGEGQDPQQLEQISQRGIRFDETIEGHGLGLAICKDIVKLYVGSISFSHSEKLGGFRVDISLPLKSVSGYY